MIAARCRCSTTAFAAPLAGRERTLLAAVAACVCDRCRTQRARDARARRIATTGRARFTTTSMRRVVTGLPVALVLPMGKRVEPRMSSSRRGAARSRLRRPKRACARGSVCVTCACASAKPKCAACIRISPRSRATRGWRATSVCRRSASRRFASAVRARISSSSPSIATAIPCGTSTGRRRCA